MRFSATAGRLAAATAFVGGLLLLGAAPAHAAAVTTIPINPGNVPTTAAAVPTHDCALTGSSSTTDGWVFNLPGNKGSFVSVTATFSTPGGTVTLTIPTDGGAISTSGGTSKAWITTPAGWTLIAATAVINGQSSNGYFVLTHTCPATSTPPSTPTPPPTTTTTITPPPPTSTSAAAQIIEAASTPAGVAVGLVLAGSLFGTGTILTLRRRRDREA